MPQMNAEYFEFYANNNRKKNGNLTFVAKRALYCYNRMKRNEQLNVIVCAFEAHLVHDFFFRLCRHRRRRFLFRCSFSVKRFFYS